MDTTLLAIQPESYWQIIKRSLRLYRASFGKVILFACLLALTAFIPRILSDMIGQDLFQNLSPLNMNRLWLVLIDLGSLLFFVAIIWHMYCVLRSVHEPLVQDFYVGLKKVLFVFIASIIQSAIIFGVVLIIFGIQYLLNDYALLIAHNLWAMFFLSFILIGQFILILYVMTLFYFYVPLITIENKGIITSLEKSILLGWNHWWRVFSVQVTPWFLYLLILIVVKFLFNINIHIYFVEHGHYSISATVFNIVLFIVYIPWVAALLVTQLRDLELRNPLAMK